MVKVIPGFERITEDDFARVVRRGPETLEEHLWFWLYREGVFTAPLGWHFRLLKLEIGRSVVKMLAPVVDWLVSCLTDLMERRNDE